MAWLSIFSMLLKLALMISEYFQRQRLLAEGEANAVKILLEKANEITRDNWAIRAAVSDSPDVLLRDEFNRDLENDPKLTTEVLLRELLPGAVQPEQGHAGVSQAKSEEQRRLDGSGLPSDRTI